MNPTPREHNQTGGYTPPRPHRSLDHGKAKYLPRPFHGRARECL